MLEEPTAGEMLFGQRHERSEEQSRGHIQCEGFLAEGIQVQRLESGKGFIKRKAKQKDLET